MKGENQFDQVQLREYAEKHLSREVEMLRWTGSFLGGFSMAKLSSGRIAGDIAAAFEQSSLESFAMHSRNLIDFLYLRNHYGHDRPNDIVVEDYVGDKVVASKLIPITGMLEGAKTKADKLVAHLSMERETFGYYEKAWMYSQIVGDLLNALRSVVYEIPDHLQSGRFVASLSSSLPLLIDIRLRQHAEEDKRGPGLAIEYGMWYKPDTYMQA